MRTTLLLALVALVCAVAVAEAARPPRRLPSLFSKAKMDSSSILDSRLPPFKTLWYQQTVDHFRFDTTQTFPQRYLLVGT